MQRRRRGAIREETNHISYPSTRGAASCGRIPSGGIAVSPGGGLGRGARAAALKGEVARGNGLEGEGTVDSFSSGLCFGHLHLGVMKPLPN